MVRVVNTDLDRGRRGLQFFGCGSGFFGGLPRESSLQPLEWICGWPTSPWEGSDRGSPESQSPWKWLCNLFFDLFHSPSAPLPQDDYPLASLPLLGYSVTVPSESENIHKDYVFKLHFKSHVYYFRSENEYTFERYILCVCVCVLHQITSVLAHLKSSVTSGSCRRKPGRRFEKRLRRGFCLVHQNKRQEGLTLQSKRREGVLFQSKR